MPSSPASGRGENDAESRITLDLLDTVRDNASISQRSLARELGIALGLTNAYLRRCIHRGWIKASQAPANRYAYYVTPKGFAEKSRLTARYLASSLHLYRQARNQFDELLARCAARGWRRVGLCGAGELAEIAQLCALQHQVEIVGVVDGRVDGQTFRQLPRVARLEELGDLDAVVVTELKRPQAAYEALANELAEERILIPLLLKIVRAPDGAVREGGA